MTEAEKIVRKLLNMNGDFDGRLGRAEAVDAINALATRLASEAAADMRQRAAELIGEWGTRQDILALPLLPAGASEGRGGGWPDIATAPKDGRDLLLLVGGPQVVQGRWLALKHTQYWQQMGGGELFPTKWHDLPSPPPAEGG